MIGTSSLRRVAQLQAYRPDLRFVPIRGNIDTRLRKLEEEELDAIVLAAAGLHRMGWTDKITEYLPPHVCLPAVGQGILGIESRSADQRVNDILSSLHNGATAAVAQAERTLLQALNGGCQVPIAGYAERDDSGQVWLRGLVASPDGRTVLRAEVRDQAPDRAGLEVAERLRAQGADQLLEATAAVSTAE